MSAPPLSVSVSVIGRKGLRPRQRFDLNHREATEMMPNRFATAVAAAFLAGAAGASAQELVSAPTSVSPVIDGVIDSAWDAATPTAVTVDLHPYKPSNGYDGVTESTVTLRALHDDTTLYMLIQWDDPTQSLERMPWVKQADGAWKQLKNPDDTGHENTYYEDKFAVLWDINARGFEKKGCAAACHMADGGMIDGIEAKSPGRKFTVAEGQTIDMWHWKSVRAEPVGQIDDQYIDHNTDAAKNSGWGRHGDSKTGGGYSNNVSEDKKTPAFMPKDGATGAFWLAKSDAVPFNDTFAAGDVLPGILISPFEGSRGDIASAAVWADGKWTVEVRRALVTTGENAAAQDVQFSDLSKAYPFGVAVFDNAAINHAYHEGVLTLKFGG